jgi:hypothetical protein
MAEDKFISGEEFKSLRQNNSQNNNIVYNKRILLIIGALIYTIVIFYIGSAYENHHNKSIATTTTTKSGLNSPFGRGGGFSANRIFGTVTAIGTSSITVSNPRTDSTSTINITSATTITENQQTIALSSINVGQTIMISLDPTNTSNAVSVTVVELSSTSPSTDSSL